MKKLTLYISILILFVFVACDESTIELEPIGDTEASFYQDESQMEMAVLGIYQKITFFYTFRGSQNSFLQGVWLLPSDDVTTPADHAYEHFVALNGNTGQLEAFYQYAYQLIARANTLLEKIEENRDLAYASEPDLADIHKGEALFLRAWMYYVLWNTFGTAPLVTERITDLDDAYPANSKDEELLDQAIIDLELATQLLPDSWDDANKGRVTKNSAFGLCGKALVFRGTVTQDNNDFIAAISDFNAIEDISLMPNYNNNFDVEYENNTESLFEFQSNNQTGVNNPFLDNDEFAVIGDIAAYYGFYSAQPSWVGNTIYKATESLMSAYEDGDPRAQYIFNTAGVDINVVKYLRNGNPVGSWASSYGIDRNNPRILRYADILLLKAEAIVRSGGNLSDAIDLVNEIRERARFSTEDGTEASVPADRDVNETDANTVLEWIFEERRLELACEEGHRWYDLRRRHIAGEIDLKSWNFSSERIDLEFKDYNINFPLPEDEVVENKNLDQNEGY